MAEEAGYFDAAGRYVPKLISLLQQVMEGDEPTADPAVLGASRLPWWCCSDRTPSPSSPPARGT